MPEGPSQGRACPWELPHRGTPALCPLLQAGRCWEVPEGLEPKALSAFLQTHQDQSLLLPGESRKRNREKGQGCHPTERPAYGNPRPEKQRYLPTTEDLIGNECQVLSHGTCLLNVIFSLPLQLSGKFQNCRKTPKLHKVNIHMCQCKGTRWMSG